MNNFINFKSIWPPLKHKQTVTKHEFFGKKIWPKFENLSTTPPTIMEIMIVVAMTTARRSLHHL